MPAAQQVHDRSDADASGASVAAQRVGPVVVPAASPQDTAAAQSPKMIAQRQRMVQIQAGAAHQPAAVLQRAIDRAQLNLVGENHGHYPRLLRARQKLRVEAILGPNTYHTEDTFSAMPDIREEGSTNNEKDLLHNFFSKADPPYYAITQGLHFIEAWCQAYRSFEEDERLLTLIHGSQRRIEKEIDSDPLKRMEGTNEERDFVLAHDTVLALDEILCDEDYPAENLLGRNVGAELVNALQQLDVAARQYRIAIEQAYAVERAEFETFMGINPHDDPVKKRSSTMGFHAQVYALHGHTGVVKMGELHLEDLAGEDLGDITLSTDDELENFLTHEEQARNGNGNGQANL